MLKVLYEALLDSLKLLPFLLVVYVAVAVLEYRYGDAIGRQIRKAGKAGPLLGALFGGIPQCGFSVMGSALYARRLITVGTLLAVFISTSDEAVPVLLSQPGNLGWIVPIITTKIVIAIIAGYGIDLALHAVRPRQGPPTHADDESAPVSHAHEDFHQQPTDEAALEAGDIVDPHHHEMTAIAHAPAAHDHDEIDEVLREHGCCDHHIAGECPQQPSAWSALLWHPLQHTLRVFAFIFLVTLALGYLGYRYAGPMSGMLLSRHPLWQPVLAALVGLIPNCAASVAITQLLIAGKITFGAAMAGLISSAGVGLLVLVKENRSRWNTLGILGLLLAISLAAGLLLQVLAPGVGVGGKW